MSPVDGAAAQQAVAAAVTAVARDAIVLVDEHGTIELFNPSAERIFGHAAGDVLGANLALLLADPDRAPGEPLAAFPTIEPYVPGERNHELLGRRADGSLFPIELHVVNVEAGGRWLSSASIQDLSKRREDEAALRRYAAVIEATTDFVGIAAPTGRLIDVNPAGRRMVGLPKALPLSDVQVGDIHAPWSRENILREGLPVALRDGMWSGESAFVDLFGREIPVSQVIITHRGPDGEVAFLSTVARDISGFKEIERMKNELVSMVSHELRTPLTSVGGAIALIGSGQLGELTPEAARLLSIARANTERLAQLIDDLLDLAKLESGREQLTLAPVDVDVLLDSAVESVAAVAAERRVRIAVDRPDATVDDPADCDLVADVDRIRQVLVNLLGNAVKFSPTDGLVRLTWTRQCPTTVRFCVVDQGPGIADAELASIFQPFHQADSSDTRRVGGTGLGLSIASNIVALHDGTLAAANAPGGGAVFTVTLPARPAPPTAGGAGEQIAPTATTTAPCPEGRPGLAN